MSRTCKCCGAPLVTGTVVELTEIELELPHARMTLYAFDRLDRDGHGIEWLFLGLTHEGKRLMVDLELAAVWYERKWPLIAARLRQLATKSKSTGAVKTEAADR